MVNFRKPLSSYIIHRTRLCTVAHLTKMLDFPKSIQGLQADNPIIKERDCVTIGVSTVILFSYQLFSPCLLLCYLTKNIRAVRMQCWVQALDVPRPLIRGYHQTLGRQERMEVCTVRLWVGEPEESQSWGLQLLISVFPFPLQDPFLWEGGVWKQAMTSLAVLYLSRDNCRAV